MGAVLADFLIRPLEEASMPVMAAGEAAVAEAAAAIMQAPVSRP